MTQVTIHVNGEAVARDVPARMHLADFVREQAGCTGTHLGCEHGVCGACTLLMDGVPVRSCITFAVACHDARVTTVEGYGDDPVMALLRRAFSKHHALQCGYCTPGMLATTRDIVLRLPDADEARVRLELAGNICRCTGYMGITRAVLDVLEQCAKGALPAVEKLRAQVGTPQGIDPAPRAAFQTFESRPVVTRGEPSVESAKRDDVASGGKTTISGSFDVKYPPQDVWRFMADLPSVAACLPGAELTEHVGDRVKGKVAIKFGPIAAAFDGAAHLERDDARFAAVLKGSGQDTLSKSRTQGDVHYRVLPREGSGTRVEVDLAYSLQGPLAQFSRSGLVKDFVGRLIHEFGRNVERRMDPARDASAPLPKAELNAFRLGLSTLWARIRRLFGG